MQSVEITSTLPRLWRSPSKSQSLCLCANVRVGFWQNGFFADFYFWAAGILAPIWTLREAHEEVLSEIAAIPDLARYPLKEFSTPRKRCDTPSWHEVSHGSGTDVTGRPGYLTVEMIGGSSASYLARTPCVPLFSALFSKAGNRRAFRLRGAGGGSFPLYGGTFARSYSVPNRHICAIPRFATFRAIIVRYPPPPTKTSSK